MARITLVSRNFPPLTGGMERLVFELYRCLRAEHEIALLGPQGCEKFVQTDMPVRSTRVSPTPIFIALTLLKGVFLHRSSHQPQIVIGGSGLVGPIVIILAKFAGAKSILLLHGLDIIAASRLYQWLFVPWLRRADVVICNSKNTARLAMTRGIHENKIRVINPGAEITGNPMQQEAAKSALALADKKILLSVGRLIPRKGLPQYIEQAFASLATADPDIVLLIAGTEPSNALNRSKVSVLRSITDAVAKFDLGDRVKLLGHADDAMLTALYSAADLFVFPLIETAGDVEGFGMVAVEAAAHGSPTVAFKCGGVDDAVIEGRNGLLVAADDYTAFNAATLKLLENDARKVNSRDAARQFARRFSWQNYGARIQGCIDEVLE